MNKNHMVARVPTSYTPGSGFPILTRPRVPKSYHTKPRVSNSQTPSSGFPNLTPGPFFPMSHQAQDSKSHQVQVSLVSNTKPRVQVTHTSLRVPKSHIRLRVPKSHSRVLKSHTLGFPSLAHHVQAPRVKVLKSHTPDPAFPIHVHFYSYHHNNNQIMILHFTNKSKQIWLKIFFLCLNRYFFYYPTVTVY